MPNETIRQTVDIVISYLNKNEMPARDLPSLIKNIFNMLRDLQRDASLTQGKMSINKNNFIEHQ
ncbi:MAG: MucR family transcriptional regulator [Magnetococcales bacterium]|nr:MucR family transcriptional regulator [Magnetococcales bacterium]